MPTCLWMGLAAWKHARQHNDGNKRPSTMIRMGASCQVAGRPKDWQFTIAPCVSNTMADLGTHTHTHRSIAQQPRRSMDDLLNCETPHRAGAPFVLFGMPAR